MIFTGDFSNESVFDHTHTLTRMPESVGSLNDLIKWMSGSAGETIGGGRVILPAGVLEIDQPILLRQHVVLEGSGPGTIIRAADGMTGPMVTNASATDRRFGIRNLTIFGNNEDVTGIEFNTPQSSGNEYADGMWRIVDVAVLFCGRDGIVVDGRGEGKVQFVDVRDIGSRGIVIESPDNDLINVTVATTGSTGIVVNAANNRITNAKVFYAGMADDTDGHGFLIEDTLLVTLVNCEAQDCVGHGFMVSGSDHIQLHGIVADSNGAGHNELDFDGNGVQLHNSDYCMVRGSCRDRQANTTPQKYAIGISGWTSVIDVHLMSSGNDGGDVDNDTGNSLSVFINGSEESV